MKKCILAIIISIMVTGCASQNNVIEKKSIAVKVATIEIGEVEHVKGFVGKAVPQQTAIVKSEIPAKVNKIHVSVGDTVQKGQLLYELDSSDLQLAVELSEKGLDMKKDSIENDAQDDLTRSQLELQLLQMQQADDDIFDKYKKWDDDMRGKIHDVEVAINQMEGAVEDGVPGVDKQQLRDLKESLNTMELGHKQGEKEWKDQLQDSKERLYDIEEMLEKNDGIVADENRDIDEATIDLAEFEHESMAKMLNDAMVYSPIDGVVESSGLKEYEFATQPMVIANKNMIAVEFMISEESVKELSIGDDMSIEISGKQYNGVVSEIGVAPEMTSSGLYKIKAVLDQAGSIIPTGAIATINLAVRKSSEDSLSVDKESIYYSDKGDYLFVVEDGKSIKKEIEIGIVSDTRAEILSGIDKDDIVIINKNSSIADGKSVRMVNAEEVGIEVEEELDPATQAKPTDTESKPTDTESKPTDTESKPTDTESKPTDTESKPTDTESKPTDTETKPTDTESKPTDTETNKEENTK